MAGIGALSLYGTAAQPFSHCNGYCWMISYDTATAPKAYVCAPDVEIATMGDIIQTNCTLVSPG